MSSIAVLSSYKLATAELKAVEAIVKEKFGATGTITNIIDKSVIAGVKIQASGREIDLTLAGSLSRMTIALS